MGNMQITLDQVLALARRLRPIDQARLVAKLAPALAQALDQVEPAEAPLPHRRLRGLLADLGPAQSAEDIDAVQHEMWAAFPQE